MASPEPCGKGSVIPPIPESVLVESGISRGEFIRRSALLAGSLSLMSLLEACGAGSSSTETAGKAVASVDWALNGTVASLDTLVLSDTNNRPVWFSIYDGLMRTDKNGKLELGLAEHWDQPDSKTIVYTLRSGLKFSDGSPLTIEDVLYTFERQLSSKVGSANAYLLGTITSVEASGDRQVTFKLSAPDIASTYAASTAAGLIVSKAFAEKQGKKLGSPSALVLGSGPYKVDSFSSGQSIVLSANPNYSGPKPAVAKHVLKMFDDEQARQVAMRSGTVKASIQFPLSQAKQWESIPGVKTSYVPFQRLQYVSMDMSQEPWDDPAVRRAVAYGVDRKGLIQAVVNGHGEIPVTVTPDVTWNGIAPGGPEAVLKDVPRYEYDPERATAELAKSPKHAGGVKASFIIDKQVSLTAQGIAENLRQIGIDLQVQELPTNDFYSRILPHKNLGMLLLAFGSDYPDPDSFIAGVAISDFAKPNYYNTANYKNQVVDKYLYDQKKLGGRVATGQDEVSAERVQKLVAASKIIMTDLPYLPIVAENASIALKDPLKAANFNGFYTSQPFFASIGA